MEHGSAQPSGQHPGIIGLIPSLVVWWARVQYGLVWYGMVRWSRVWCGMVWYGGVQSSVVWYG